MRTFKAASVRSCGWRSRMTPGHCLYHRQQVGDGHGLLHLYGDRPAGSRSSRTSPRRSSTNSAAIRNEVAVSNGDLEPDSSDGAGEVAVGRTASRSVSTTSHCRPTTSLTRARALPSRATPRPRNSLPEATTRTGAGVSRELVDQSEYKRRQCRRSADFAQGLRTGSANADHQTPFAPE